MTRDEAKERMKMLVSDDGDIEAQHGVADDILCDLLISLGYWDLIEIYHKVPKWYA